MRNVMRSGRRCWPVLLLLCGACFSQLAMAEDPGRAATDVAYTWGVRIPMRDGVELNATLYQPPAGSNAPARLPAIITITPYISDRYQQDAQYFARNGYAFLVVDTRGRGNSDGDFRPFSESDGQDGYDVVEWVAGQPWSNGKVALRGGSYGGYNQWSSARYFPPHLTTIVPIAAAFPGVDFPMGNNISYPYIIQWATLTSGRTGNNNAFGDSGFWARKFRQYHQGGIAFEDLDELVGNRSTPFDEWLSHPTQDEHWAAAAPSTNDFERFALPVLTITGYYDGDQPGAMEYYRRHMQHGSEQARANHYLLLGPWDHAGTRIPNTKVGGYEFGDQAMFDAYGLDKAWYDWTMGEGERPAMLKDRVTYFVAGKNEWKSAPSLEDISDREMSLYLSSPGSADSLFHSGGMSESVPEPSAAAFDSYVYDPLDTSKVESDPAEDYILDPSEAAGTDGDGLIYHSEPFTQDTEVTGYMRLEAWFELNVPDTDINVTVYEILSDGTSIALSGQAQRARYRTSLERETLVKEGEVLAYDFNRFFFISRLVKKGSRLRLFVRPANNLDQQRNYNSGKPVSKETRADARTATVRLYHSPEYPSRLILPIVSGD